ncbi:MAG: hypothetical protein GY861_00835 [bacterium]|nr:hypothetical protein [bacterium]
MIRTNSINNSFTGTSSAVKILDSDVAREYICFYAVSGDCEIVIGANTFADNAITIEEGVMWEPKQVLTGSVYFKGDGSKLTVLY